MKSFVKVLLLLSMVALVWLSGRFGMRYAQTRSMSSLYGPQVQFSSAAWRSEDPGLSDGGLSQRQLMIADLVENILPGKSRAEIEELLGTSPTHGEMQRQDGSGWYFDELGWDLIYPIGKEQFFLVDSRGQWMSPESEYLVLRLDADDNYTSWYVAGSKCWPVIVSEDAQSAYTADAAEDVIHAEGETSP